MTSAVEVSSPFNANALRLICKRYAHRGSKHPECPRCGIHHEDEDQLIERISLGKQEYIDKLFHPLRFLPNSPTIFNLPCAVCGETKPAGTLSACFKFDVEDSMTGIMEVARKAAMVLKYGGGVGYYVGDLRHRNAPIRSTHGAACGPVAVLRHYQSVATMVTQAGKRFAAQMAIMDDDHPDIHEFIHMKDDDPQAFNSFNISVAASDDFMGAIAEDEETTVLFEEIVKSAWRTGDPGLYFKDAAERGNPTPWLGRLTGSNPCGEVPLLDSEACNLGSLILPMFRSYNKAISVHGGIDWGTLERTSAIAVSYLDDILDQNSFPDQAITDAVMRTRKLGLGVMGWADLLALLHIPYDSQDAVDLGDATMNHINAAAHEESVILYQLKGAAPCYEGSPVRQESIRRNATLTCIAPTGSISMLAGCSSGIEPHYALEWTHEMGDGEITQHRITVADRLNGFVPKAANEISVDWHLAHQAAFQKHTDLAVSKTINMPNSATIEDVRHAYLEAWRLGCKGVTVFRDGCRTNGEQVLVSTLKALPDTQANVFVVTSSHDTLFGTDGAIQATLEGQKPLRHRLERERKALNHRFQVGDQEGYLSIGLFPDGSPGEMFVTISKQGSTVGGLADAVAILTSLALQYGIPLEALVRKFRHTRFEPSGRTDSPEQPFASSVLDYVFGYMQRTFLGGGKETPAVTGELCPECGGTLVHAEGCVRCLSCSYDRCG